MLERLFATALASLVALPASAAPFDRIEGSVRYAERVALPPDASLTLELLDVTRQEARPDRLARLALPTRGRQIPLAFELPYHAADVETGHRYVLRATLISGGGELLFVGTHVALIPPDKPVDLLMQRAHDPVPAASLENTYWKLVEVGGHPARVQAGEREAHLLLLDGRASGSSGCNKLMGGYTPGSRNVLSVGPLASTRMACTPELMTQEAALHDAYARTTHFRIDGESLVLLNGEAVLARFAARHFK